MKPDTFISMVIYHSHTANLYIGIICDSACLLNDGIVTCSVILPDRSSIEKIYCRNDLYKIQEILNFSEKNLNHIQEKIKTFYSAIRFIDLRERYKKLCSI